MTRRAIELVWPGKDDPVDLAPTSPTSLSTVERHGDAASPNVLVHGDNLDAMRAWLATHEGKVDLVAIDPPFATNLHYYAQTDAGDERVERHAYADRGGSGLADYLSAMRPRLMLIHRLLGPEGKLFLHCDWRANALLRVLLDEIFGPDCFRNEIVWRRAPNLGRQAAARQLGRVVDSIFVYSKSPGAPFRGEAPRKSTPVPLDRHGKPRGARWDDAAEAYFTTAPRGDYTDKSIAELRAQNRVYDSSAGKVYIKYFLRQDEGGRWVKDQPVDTLWDDYEVRPLRHRPKGEEMGYDTQKPEGLLERIVRWATRPGDLVLDVYAGSGTTLAVAERLGRRWLGCDVGEASIAIVRRRLLGLERPASFRIVRPLSAASDGVTYGGATATVRVHEGADGVRLELASVEGQARALRGATKALGWAESVDAWMVDYAPSEVFAPTFVAHRTRRGTVALETPPVPRARLGARARVVVHTVYGASAVVDVPLGGEP
ncbi:MAG: site-specific DNA-methyltransferase [Deltaproteobacteria bacterium]|nr:site-specific DNA-methyltransferase [Deltaproteobacteria bacterium]